MVSYTDNFVGNGVTKSWKLTFYPIPPFTSLYINDIQYFEGSNFTVNYDNKTLTLSSGVPAPAQDIAIVATYNTNLTKTFKDIVSDVIYRISTSQSEVTDYNVGSVVRTIVEAIVYELGISDTNALSLYSQLSNVFNSAFIETATGDDLDNLVKLVGVTRLQASKSTGIVTFSRSGSAPSDITIPSGTIVSTIATGTIPAIRFSTTSSVILTAGNLSVDCPVECEITGTIGNVGIGAIDTIVTPIVGIETVTNSDSISGGDERETDNQLRERAKHALDVSAKATENAIKYSILAVSGIEQCKINQTALGVSNETITFTLPTLSYTLSSTPVNFIIKVMGTVAGNPYTFEQGTDYVLSVNNIVWNSGGTKPDNGTDFYVDYEYEQNGGINVIVAGSASLSTAKLDEVKDIVDNVKAAGISRSVFDATPREVDVTCTVTVKTGYDAPTVKANVQSAIINHLNTLDIGTDVYLAALFQKIMDVTGVENVAIATPTSDVTIYPGERAKDGVITVM